jgi:ribonucleoside-diphosphate reductase alpha chain
MIDKLLKDRYFLKDETTWEQLADRVGAIYPEITEDIKKMTFVPGSPFLMNANTKGERRGTLSSCFPMNIEDSIDDIMDSMKEAAEVTKMGGGVGYDFSVLRGKNEVVKGNGKKSGGVLSFIGIYDAVLDGIKQGGCLTKDTYILTREGLFRFDELFKNEERGWYNQDLNIINDKGTNKSKRYFVNGKSEIIEICSENGIVLKGTPDHKLQVICDGVKVFKQMKDITSSDWLIIPLGRHEGQEQQLIGVDKNHYNQTQINLPKKLDKDFGFILGYLAGDGFVASGDTDYRIGFSVAHDSYLMEDLPKKLKKIFGDELHISEYKKENDKSSTFIINNKLLKDFFKINCICKEKSDKVSVPLLIRKSNKEIIGSYLRGYFEADGSVSHGYPSFNSVSDELTKEISLLLLGIGCPNTITKRKMINSYSKREYINYCKIETFVGLNNWKKYIGADDESRFFVCNSFYPNLSREKCGVIPNYKEYLNGIMPIILQKDTEEKRKLYKELNRYNRNERNFSFSTNEYLRKKISFWSEMVDIPYDMWYSKVKSNTKKVEEITFDLEVENVHLYIANGVISHNSRRGAGMSLLSIFHPQILDFIDAKKDLKKYNRSNFSVKIPNKFYEILEKDPDRIFKTINVVDKKENDLVDSDGKVYTYKMLWEKIIENAWSFAEPGIINEDYIKERVTVNHIDNKALCNPCLMETALVLTPEGIKQLKNINIGDLIWSNSGWTTVINKWYTGEKDVYEYETRAGNFTSTDNHRIVNGTEKIEVKDADVLDVITGMSNYNHLDNFNVDIQDIIDGLVIGDGCINSKNFKTPNRKKDISLIIGNDDMEYLDSIVKEKIIGKLYPSSDNMYEIDSTITVDELPPLPKRKIPDRFFYGDEKKKIGFLIGLYSANGSICGNRITLKSTCKELILQVQTMLNSMGIISYYTVNKPTLISWHNGDYTSKESFDLNVGAEREIFYNIIKFLQQYKNKKIEDIILNRRKIARKKTQYEIISKKSLGIQSVYDITVDNDSHTFWCNGFNISNCSEFVTTVPYSPCCLGSIDVSKFVKDGEFDKVSYYKLVRKAVRFLDASIDVNDFPLQKIKDVALSHRPIGLGMMGFAHLLYKLKIPYNSQDAKCLAGKLMKEMTIIGMDESINIAKEKGSFKWYNEDVFLKANERYFEYDGDCEEIIEKLKKYGCRNSSISSIAPTGTISTLSSTSSGIEPVFGLVYTRKIETGNKTYTDMYVVDPVFEKFIEEKYKKYKDEIYKYISDNKGSIRGCNYITKEEQDLFVVAGDITPEWHLNILEMFAKYVSLSVSKTINMPKDATKEEVSKVYLDAFKKGIIGVTVYRDTCREGILVHNNSEDKENDLVDRRNAPKRPQELECDMFLVKVKDDYIAVLVGKLKGMLYEMFVGGTDEKLRGILKEHKIGKIVKIKNNHYRLYHNDDILIDNLGKFGSTVERSLARFISMSLRHGTPLKFIVEQLNKSDDFMSFDKVVSRVLKQYIKDGEVYSSEKCPECGGKLIYKEGCISCSSCYYNKCG